MKKLDRTRAFATVHGEGDLAWNYEQDGARFNAQGEFVEADPNYKPPKNAKTATAGDVDEAVTRALAAQQAEFDKRLAEQQEANQKAIDEAVAKAMAAAAGAGTNHGQGHDAGSQLEKQAGGHGTKKDDKGHGGSKKK